MATPEVKTSYLLILDGGDVSEFSDEERCWGDSPLESDGQQVREFSWLRETGRILRRDSELIAPTGLKAAEGEFWETGECGGWPHPVGRAGTSVLHQVSWRKWFCFKVLTRITRNSYLRHLRDFNSIGNYLETWFM